MIASAKGAPRACAREAPYEPAPPDRSAKPLKLPPHLEDPPLWAALCSWLGLSDDAKALSRGTAANLRRLAALYLKAGENADRVEADSKAWHRDDWRGRQNQPPTVAQAMDWRARCRSNGHAPPGRAMEDPSWRQEPKVSEEDWDKVKAATRAGDLMEASRLAALAAENCRVREAALRERQNGGSGHEH